MRTIKKSQMVIRDRKDKNQTEVKQSVSIDTKDQWITIVHDGEELSMSMENYRKLIWLVSEMTR